MVVTDVAYLAHFSVIRRRTIPDTAAGLWYSVPRYSIQGASRATTVPPGLLATAADAQRALASGVASLIFGILSLLLFGVYSVGIVRGLPYAASFACGIFSAVLGHVARAQARRAAVRRRTAPLALVGLVLSYVGVFLSVAIFALVAPVTRTISY